MWNTSTLHVKFGERNIAVEYPFSPSMKAVLTRILTGREYPLGLPAEYEASLIVDIGANVGAASLWFHHRHSQASIIAYEPSPSIFQFLQKNTAAFPQISVYPYGLFSEDRSCRIHLGKHHAAQSAIVAYEGTGPVVESIRLRNAAEELRDRKVEQISILKIDTEGCEVPILQVLQSWLPRTDFVYIEYHSEDDRRQIDQLLGEDFYLIRCEVERANRATMVFVSRALAHQLGGLVAEEIRIT